MAGWNVRWVKASNGNIPPGGFLGGKDLDSNLYVGRTQHGSETLPGKVNPKHKTCYISWGGNEISKREYEVLVGENYEWIRNRGGNIPLGAVPASDGSHGEVMYIGRVQHDGTRTIGKVHPSHGVCYIPFGGKELSFVDYEILMPKTVTHPAFKYVLPPEAWNKASHGRIPSGSFVGGYDHTCELHVGRAHHENDIIPGKVHKLNKVCYIPWGGKEISREHYEVLSGNHLEWISSSGSNIPVGAIHGGRTRSGETLYIGRVHHDGTHPIGKVQPSHGVCYIPYGGKEMSFHNYEILIKRSGGTIFEKNAEKAVIPGVKWVEAREGYIPAGAFEGGRDMNGGDLYVGRVKHRGELIPGKVHPQHRVCYFPWSGSEHPIKTYEVLCGRNLKWTSTSGAIIPNNAVYGGLCRNGEVLFICRVHHKGCSVIGKVHPSHGVCYFPFGGKEISHHEYQILVTRD